MKRQIKSHLQALLVLTTLVLMRPLYAEDTGDQEQEELREYDVELIIFEDAHARYMHSESWQQEQERPVTENLEGDGIDGHTAKQPIAKAQKSQVEKSFTSLPVGMLNQQYRRLGLSSEVKVLYRD